MQKPTFLEVVKEPNDRSDLTIGVDVGGTSLRAGLVDDHGTMLAARREPLRPGQAAGQVETLVRELASESAAQVAVVGLPGRVDRVNGTLDHARNLPGTELTRLSAASLAASTGMEVHLAGDAELAALGETHFGAGDARGTTGFLTFSTGAGAACTSGGRLVGGDVVGFQIGFLHLLGPERPMIDQLASGQRVRLLAEQLGQPVQDVQALRALVGAGDKDAAAAWADITAAAAEAALLVCHVCSPDVIVVGGGVSRGAGADFVAGIAAAVAQRYTSVVDRPVDVRPGSLGDDAALVGAAAWRRAYPHRTHRVPSPHSTGQEAAR